MQFRAASPARAALFLCGLALSGVSLYPTSPALQSAYSHLSARASSSSRVRSSGRGARLANGCMCGHAFRGGSTRPAATAVFMSLGDCSSSDHHPPGAPRCARADRAVTLARCSAPERRTWEQIRPCNMARRNQIKAVRDVN